MRIVSESLTNVVDSSAWLEYFAGGPNADHFANAIEDTSALVVPSITLLEVFKRIARQRDEATALQYVAESLGSGLVSRIRIEMHDTRPQRFFDWIDRLKQPDGYHEKQIFVDRNYDHRVDYRRCCVLA